MKKNQRIDINSLLYKTRENLDIEQHILARYFIRSKTSVTEGAKAIALGQSIGPMHIRTKYENKQLFHNHGAKIIGQVPKGNEGIVEIAFPAHNIDPETDGISQLLCTLAGGQYDISILEQVRLLDFQLPQHWASFFPGPRFGLSGIREILKVYDRPLLGAIIKPKTGLSPKLIAEICYELALGGCDFIKEDEILGNPFFCRMEERVPLISEILQRASRKTGTKTLYAPCLTVGVKHLKEHCRKAVRLGATALHFNLYCGLSSYRMIAEDPQISVPIHVQRSGDMAYTKDPHHGIDAGVICQAIRLCGGDLTHAGMLGGYIATPPEQLERYLEILKGPFFGFRSTIPAISGGTHPGLVQVTYERLGKDIMFMVGGAIMGHPQGMCAGARAMRQAIDATVQGIPIEEAAVQHKELETAIKEWGIVKSLT